MQKICLLLIHMKLNNKTIFWQDIKIEIIYSQHQSFDQATLVKNY